MANATLQQTLNANLHHNTDAKIGRKYVTFNVYAAKGANNSERGKFSHSLKIEISEVEKSANDSYALSQLIGRATLQQEIARMK